MNYQRILSYLYDYDRGVKRKNIGFVKVETRQELCRVNIHMKLQEFPVPEMLRVYFFFRRNDEILGIPFADAKPVGNECDVRSILPASFFEACGFAPDEFAGVYICRDDRSNLVYVSAWDDVPVYVETFRELKPTEENPGGTDTNGVAEGQAGEPGTEEQQMSEPETAGQQTGEPETEEQTGDAGETERSEETRPKKATIQLQPEETGRGNFDEAERLTANRSPWEKLAANFTKFRITDGDAQLECLKIRPHHLALLPRRYWDDTNCSFLLHGYYTYGHIILARREPGEEYFLGIPGKNRDRDRVMAAYYGYTNYLPTARKNQNYGYWCREILL
ncbi:MAG: hypothetical protein LUE29_11715 [Lachnospiraceae bacterium]|nr:hypothetical protein [Lachnospiraceae bacterium]